MNILVVDDEPIIRSGIQRTIQRTFPQHKVILAEGPIDAVERLKSDLIDLVLTDVLMPGMNGLELMEVSRTLHPDAKWVVISAYSEFEYAKKAVRLGARDYLLKPIGKDILVELIKKMGDEIEESNVRAKESQLLKQNLRFLREAVFARWASGLDLGGIDLASFTEAYPDFHLLMVHVESDADTKLEHFIVENVMNELIGSFGRGFVASIDAKSLLGLVKLERSSLSALNEELRGCLKRYLKKPFQLLASGRIEDPSRVPDEVRLMRETSEYQVYDHYASGGEQAVEVALQYIKARYASELSLEKVASVVYLNAAYFSQLFKQKTGQGFKDYVTQIRLDRAMEMLGESELKVGDIAERVGYPDVRHFSQVFRKKIGSTPSEYREQMKSRC
ncbi:MULTISPECIES: response regulator transcription factor [Saccharibacillus]|uniref:Response regulator n=1 Tax=Saccharibacillus brassicae TaxID=2583377 RepID=A0A4Y6UUJ6_SACBS|nr:MULTISPECIES: response regulator [Saccharibacillus]MWJ31530.1 response regulator [Saccharibacillus sp. WB 17]QDH20228.1 response regulator [Saccharibacillus brassicae]